MLPSGEKGIEIARRGGRGGGERGRMLVISVSVNIIVCLWNFGGTTTVACNTRRQKASAKIVSLNVSPSLSLTLCVFVLVFLFCLVCALNV